MTLAPLQFNEFATASKRQWLEGANAQLKTDNADNELVWEFIDGINLPPYFDKTDSHNLDYLSAHFSDIEFEWQLIKTIDVKSEISANKSALKALIKGCSGILFICSGKVDLHQLTNNILFEHCLVSFSVPDNMKQGTIEFMRINKVNGFCRATNDLALPVAETTIEIAELLAGYTKDPTLNNVIIKIGRNFFFEIARLRALRYLVGRVSSVQDIPNNDFWIHAGISTDSVEDKNLLVQTSAGLAAVIGGANSVSFSGNQEQDRIATNVGSLIRDEAKIHAFQDASGGSHFIDFITDQLIQKVWSQFQKLQA